MKETIRRLPDAELEVMQAVWACEPPVGRSDIEAIVDQSHPMAVTTLLARVAGLVLFLSFWETKARYAFQFTPLLLLLAAAALLPNAPCTPTKGGDETDGTASGQRDPAGV